MTVASPAFRAGPSDLVPLSAIASSVPVRMRNGMMAAADVERAAQFAAWLAGHWREVRELADGRLPANASREWLADFHRRLRPQDISAETFVEAAQDMPFSQVLADLADFSGERRHDKDEDMRAYVVEALSPVAGDTVLDAGCSTGRNFLPYPEGVTCIGCDLHLPSLMVGAHAWKAHASPSKPVLCCESILSMSMGDNSIDCVQSFVVLGQVPINGALQEIRRVLRPGGRLALTLEGPGFLRELWELPGASVRDRIGLSRWLIGRKLQERGIYWQGHRRFGKLAGVVQYSPASIAHVLERNGFQVVDARSLRDYGGEPRLIGVTARKPAS